MEIGTITRLQVQRASLKVPDGNKRRYDPTALCAVDWLEIDPDGVQGGEASDSEGRAVIDVHHARHPESKNRNRTNGLSIGFTSHYDRMRARFGAHMVDGIAGENVLIESDHGFVAADLPEELELVTASGERIRLGGVQVAEPCVEFTRFALQRDRDAPNDSVVSAALDFLRRGMRGYYARVEGPMVRVRVGDRLLVSWR